MKKAFLLSLLCFSMITFSFAQTDDEVKNDVKVEMDQLKIEMKELSKELNSVFKDLKVDLQDMEIDLSGLEQLQNMDLDIHLDEEAMNHLNSEEFKNEMKKMQLDISEAMKDVKVEIGELENIHWEKISDAIKNSMKELELELSNIREER